MRVATLTECPRSRQQFFRFAVVGFLNLVVSSAVFIFCYRHLRLGDLILNGIGPAGVWITQRIAEFGVREINAAAASTAAYLAGMVNSFSLNKVWTFEAAGSVSRQLGRFVVLNAAGMLTSAALLLVFVDMLAFPYLLVWFPTVGIVLVMNFVGNKYWTFYETTPARNAG